MLSLVLKDILLLKKYFIFGFAYTLAISIAFQYLSGIVVPVASTIALTHVFIQNACAYDYKNQVDLLLNSLPLKRKDIVQARYLSVFIFGVLAIISFSMMVGLIRLFRFPFKVSSVNAEQMGLYASVFGVIYGFGTFFEAIGKTLMMFLGGFRFNPLLGFAAVSLILVTLSYHCSARFYASRDF